MSKKFVFASIVNRLKDVFRRFKQRRTRPIRSTWHDVKLVQRTQKKHLPTWKQISHFNRILSTGEKRIMLLCLIVLGFGLFSVGSKIISKYRIDSPINGGTYKEAVVGSPQYVNPIFATTNDTDLDLVRLIYSGLMRYDEKYRLVPDLAVKYEVSNDSKTYTFELKKDIVWHDGEPFTAKDVVFTFETIQNPAVGSPLFVTFQGVKVVAVDDYTVQFILQEPFAGFLGTLATGILPEHAWFEILPEQMRLAKINLQPIGTGPFKFNKFFKDDTGHIYQYELARFDRYYRRASYLDTFIFEFYPTLEGDTGAIKAFREQKVQGLSFVPNALRDKVESKNVILHTLDLPQYTALFFNQDNQPILKDNDIRLALAESIDKERILREVLQGNGKVSDGPILPGFPGYSADIKKIAFSFDEANKLLDKNWPRISAEDYQKSRLDTMLKEWEEKAKTAVTTSTDLIAEKLKVEEEFKKQLTEELQAAQTFYRKNKSGTLLEIDLVTANNKEYQQAAGLIAGFWESIGVKTNLKFVDVKNFSRDVLKSRSYDILLYGEVVGSDPDPYPFWHSSQIDAPGFNLARYVNRSVDALIEKIRGSADQTSLDESYRKFQEIILGEMPAIFLYIPNYTYATTNDIKGMNLGRIAHPSDRLAGAVNWYLKTKGQWNFKK